MVGLVAGDVVMFRRGVRGTPWCRCIGMLVCFFGGDR